METFYLNKCHIYSESSGDLLDVGFVPSLIRRRMSQLEKIGVYLEHKTRYNDLDYKLVFSSNHSEIRTTYKLIEHHFKEKDFLPSKFSTSVLNATCGLLCIINKDPRSYTSICGGSNSVEIGLLESFISGSNCLFIYADESIPELYCPYMNSSKGQGISCFISKQQLEPDSIKIQVSFENQESTTNNKNKGLSFLELADFLNKKQDYVQGSFMRLVRVYD